MKKAIRLFITILSIFTLVACGSEGSDGSGQSTHSASSNGGTDEIKIIWMPGESGNDAAESREALENYIAEATGKEVVSNTSTDFAVAIQALANGEANIALMGAQQYILANQQNDAVQPLVVNSGESGTLDDALYNSWMAVLPENADQYVDDSGEYSIDNIKGQRFSFVSTSSTSGFAIPTATIIDHFDSEDLSQEDLMEGGEGQFFSEVLFGETHAGSAINVLQGNSDVSAFCDECMVQWVELADGEENTPGATYRIHENAGPPFEQFVGREFTLINNQPVLNGPIVVNTEVTSEEDIQAMIDILTSEEVASDERIFGTEEMADQGIKTLFQKDSENSRLVAVEDAWFDPLRD